MSRQRRVDGGTRGAGKPDRPTAGPRVGGGEMVMVYEAVRREMERFFGDDMRRIAHALEVASHALRIRAAEGGDRAIVMMASLLHDVGIKPAEERYGSGAGLYQEKLGPPIAGEIRNKL